MVAKTFFCIVSFTVFVNAPKCTMCVVAKMQLFDFVERSILTEERRTHIATLTWMQSVPCVSLNVAKKSVTEVGTLALKKCAFISSLIFITIS